jgi:Lon protease-like protein
MPEQAAVLSSAAPLQLKDLPLFPLGSPMFPGGQLNLRLFEVRYLSMMRKCHEVGAPFGVVLLTQGGEVRKPGETEAFHDTGTLATIGALSPIQSGLMHAQCAGVSRFKVLHSHCLPSGLWVADVEQIAADPFIVIPDDLRYVSDMLATLARDLTASERLTWKPEEAQFDDCGWVANRWAELLPVKPELKQGLMAMPSPLMRLELVGDILDKLSIRRKSDS